VHQRRFEIGVAMALCHGVFRRVGMLFGKLSQRDQEARQKALDDSLAHESQDKTTSYVLPDNPEITGTITPVSPSRQRLKSSMEWPCGLRLPRSLMCKWVSSAVQQSGWRDQSRGFSNC
jgi:hypothetical protein